MNHGQIERTILRILSEAHPNMMRSNVLCAETQVSVTDTLTKADFEARIRALENAAGGAQIVGVTVDGITKYRITAEGLARLASN